MSNKRLMDDVPGWEDNVYRCCIPLCRISIGIADFLILICTFVTTVTGGYLGVPQFDQKTQMVLSIIASVAGSISIFLHLYKTYADKAVELRKRDLENVIRESDEVVPPLPPGSISASIPEP